MAEMPARLVRAVRDFMTAWQVPGAVVAVGTSEGGTELTAIGSRDLAATEPMGPDALFEIGSISKVATACCVLRLVEQGLVRLESRAADLLPWLPQAWAAPQVTVLTLLQHTAGLPASVDALPDPIAQLLIAPRTLGPGRRFHYSNVGYLVLGEIIAHVARRPFPEVVADLVLAPCGMADSLPQITDEDLGRLTTGHWPARVDAPHHPGSRLVPAPAFAVAGADGNLATTAADLTAFGRMLARSGRGDQKQVLDPASFELMTTLLAADGEPVVQLSGSRWVTSSRYGLGINVESWTSRTDVTTVLSHGGGMVGYASFLHVEIPTGRVVAVLTNANGDSPVAEVIARAVAEGNVAGLDAVRPERFTDEKGSGYGSSYPPPIDPSMLGRFVDDRDTLLELRLTGDELAVRFGEREYPARWSFTGRLTVRAPGVSEHGLIFDTGVWVSGERVFRREARRRTSGFPGSPQPDFCGRYRSYSPWLPELLIVLRDDQVRLITFGGVESPGADVALVAAADGSFAVGSADAPDRVTVGPVVGAQCAWIDYNGCRYSRTTHR